MFRTGVKTVIINLFSQEAIDDPFDYRPVFPDSPGQHI